jgi:hypothetical protein
MWTAAAAHAASLAPVVIIVVAGLIDLIIGAAPGVAAGEVARVVLVICGRDECNLQDKNMVSDFSCLNFCSARIYFFHFSYIYQVPVFFVVVPNFVIV